MRKPFLLLALASVLLLSCQKQQPAPEPEKDSEWWHFTLRNEPFPDTYFDFPIRQL